MARQRLRLGLIGCGEIAAQTAQGIAESAYAEHVMVMDIEERLARDLGETYGVAHTTRVEELLANMAVDAVYIAVPHHLLAPLSIQAARAGRHVLVEKPMATTLADADAAIAAARQAGIILSVALTAQVDRDCLAIRQLIAAGAIGKVIGTRIVLRIEKGPWYWSGGYTGRVQSDWRGSKARAGGGLLIINTVHDLNTLRFVTGLEVTRLSCEYDTLATPVEVEDIVSVAYRYDNGAIGAVDACSAVRGQDPFEEIYRIYGDAGQIIRGSPPRIFVTNAVAGLTPGVWQDVPVAADGPRGDRVAVVDGFARAVLAGEPPPVRAEDGRAALAFITAAYQSGREHRTIELGGGSGNTGTARD